MKNKKFLIDVFKKAAISRHFEINVFNSVKSKEIQIPVYLSAGQETISASLATIIDKFKFKPLIFAQHRCHATYLSFGGNIKKLLLELLEDENGCTGGLGGSASIHSKKINMFGHDGHMGTQVPIATGACYQSKKPTIVFMGDASAEEDYVLAALGWASTKKLPILFIVEDNNLSILTEKKTRRNWHMHDVAKSFKMQAFDIKDNPLEILKYKNLLFKQPLLLNINTNRLFWHSGAGVDSQDTFDRYKSLMKNLGNDGIIIDENSKKKMDLLWKKTFEKQLKI